MCLGLSPLHVTGEESQVYGYLLTNAVQNLPIFLMMGKEFQSQILLSRRLVSLMKISVAK